MLKSCAAHLAGEQLPEYMVPVAYVQLQSLPLTPNGKVDRKALPAPEGDAYSHREYEAPQGELEESLAQLWQDLLKVDRVGRHDDFFALGGHSLLAITPDLASARAGIAGGCAGCLPAHPRSESWPRSCVSRVLVEEVPPNRIPAGVSGLPQRCCR